MLLIFYSLVRQPLNLKSQNENLRMHVKPQHVTIATD